MRFQDDSDDLRVPASTCEIHHHVVVTSLTIARASGNPLAQLRELIDPRRPVILDFDLDYFSTESPMLKMMGYDYKKGAMSREAKVIGETLWDMQQRLKGVFCAKPPHTSAREQAVDMFLRGVVSSALVLKERGEECLPKQNKWQKFAADYMNFVNDSTALTGLSISNVVDALCSSDQESDRQLSTLHDVIMDVSSTLAESVPSTTIHELLKYGFCMDCDEVPRENYSVWACAGSSTPWDLVQNRVELHTACHRGQI